MGRIKRDPNATPIPEKVLASASKLFVKLGIESASMQAIAEDAGITAAAIYYHFASKEELVFQTLLKAAEGLVNACEPTLLSLPADPEEALHRFVEAYVIYQLTDIQTVAPVYTALVHGLRRQNNVLTPDRSEVLRKIETKHLANLKRILKAGTDQGLFFVDKPTLTAFAIIGMCEHTAQWFVPNGPLSANQIALFMADEAVALAKSPSPKRGRAKPAAKKATRTRSAA